MLKWLNGNWNGIANWASVLGFVWPLLLGFLGFVWGGRRRQMQLQRLIRREAPRLLAGIKSLYQTMTPQPSLIGEAYLGSMAEDASHLVSLYREPKMVASRLVELEETLRDVCGSYYEWLQLPADTDVVGRLRDLLRYGQHLLETLDVELLFAEEA